MSHEERLSKVRSCAQRCLTPTDIERTITLVETLENLQDLRQLMAILGQKSAT